MIRTFDPENCTLVITRVNAATGVPNSYQVKNWESAFFSYTDERYDFQTSTTGHITRSRILNRLGSCSIIAPEASDCGRFLGGCTNSKDKISVAFSEDIVLPTGKSNIAEFVLSEGAVTNAGDGGRARVAGQRTWVVTGEITKFEDKDYLD